jgi:hypothetical protein
MQKSERPKLPPLKQIIGAKLDDKQPECKKTAENTV